MEESKLNSLDYKEFAGYPSLNGFYSTTVGPHLFLALFEHFALKGKKANEIIEVDSDYFKCKFNLEDTMEPLPRWEGNTEEEEEEEPEKIETMVTAQV